jgi:hypothetical protein
MAERKKWVWTRGRQQTLAKNRKMHSVYVRLGREVYEKQHR